MAVLQRVRHAAWPGSDAREIEAEMEAKEQRLIDQALRRASDLRKQKQEQKRQEEEEAALRVQLEQERQVSPGIG